MANKTSEQKIKITYTDRKGGHNVTFARNEIDADEKIKDLKRLGALNFKKWKADALRRDEHTHAPPVSEERIKEECSDNDDAQVLALGSLNSIDFTPDDGTPVPDASPPDDAGGGGGASGDY